MATVVTTPAVEVTVNGEPLAVLSLSTSHGVESPTGTASLTVPLPVPNNVVEDAPVRVRARGDAGEDWETIFKGRVRGPIDKTLSESDATATLRCDGPSWRLALPLPYDLTWVGPIAPREVIRALLALSGMKDYRVEHFVHPVTGVPILLGGVPWFDEGRVVLARGTSPLAFVDRLCRLWGYRCFDRPDGEFRVARVSGPPPETDYVLTEGVDFLNVSRVVDLHEIATQWEVTGASGTDAAGQQVAVVSRPVRGVRSRFVPNPPKYALGSISDPLIVLNEWADAARIAAEYDQAGVPWRVRGEVVGANRRTAGLAPRNAFRVVAPTAGIGGAGKVFWQTAVSVEWSERGYWVTVEGWRPTGKPATTAPPPDPVPPDEPAEEGDDPVAAPDPADLDPWEDGADPLPPTWEDDGSGNPWGNADGDPAPSEDPLDPYWTDPAGAAPDEHPAGFDPCDPPPAAPPRACRTVGVLEPGWATEVPDPGPLVLPFDVPAAGDSVTVSGELLGGATAVALWQSGAQVGSTATAPAAVAWTGWEATFAGAVAAGAAELRLSLGA